jgi:hypothetical protein
MGVLAIKDEPRCKLCSHPKRHDIDALLERRSNREQDEAGNQINAEYVLRILGDWGVTNPTEENLKVHFRKHCEVVSSEEVAVAQGAVLLAVEQAQREGVVVDVNADLDWLWMVWMLEIRERVARGEKSGLPVDFGLKVAAEKTRRSHNESQDELLRALTGGMAVALGQRKTAPMLPSPEVVEDAEFSEAE